jgi:hypothetical protein
MKMRHFFPQKGEAFIVMMLSIIVVAGIFFRFNDLGAQSFWMDEGYTVIATQSIEQTGAPVLASGTPYSCEMYCAPSALIAKQFGDSPTSYRLLAAITGTLLILVVFFIGRELADNYVGLVAAALVSLSYYQIAWSRQARWYTEFELFFWLAVFCLIKSRRSLQPIWWWLASAFFTILAIKTHSLGYLLPILLILWLVGEALVSSTIKWSSVALVLVLTIFAAYFSGLATPNAYHGLAAYFQIHNWFYLYTSFFWRSYWLVMLFALCSIIFALFKKKYIWSVAFLTSSILLYFIPLAFFAKTIEYRYLLHATIALDLLAAIGFTQLCRVIPSRFARSALIFISAALLYISSIVVIFPQPQYLLESDDPAQLPGRGYYAYTAQPNWQGAYAYIKNNASSTDAIISTQPQLTKIYLGKPGMWLGYNYLGFDAPPPLTKDGRDMYVGARVILTLAQLQQFAALHHGFLLIDYMAMDGRVPQNILDYISANFSLVYENEINDYSHVWVYRF